MGGEVISLSITGDIKTDKALAALPKKLQRKALKQATKQAAQIVLADSRRRAPRDTGLLSSKLVIRTAKRGDGRRMPRGIMGHAVMTREGLFAGEAFYGGFLEFGTKPRRTKSGAFRGQVAEMRFLRDSLYNNSGRVRAVFRKKIRSALQGLGREAR